MATPPFRRLFFVGDQYLGESPCDWFFAHEELRAPYSYIWFCDQCGEVYARSPVLNPAGKQSPWQSFAGCCRRCPSKSMYRPPGSLWLNWDKAFIATFTDAVWRYEAERHLEQFDRTKRS